MVSLLTYPYSEGFLERVYKKRFCFVLNGFSLSLSLSRVFEGLAKRSKASQIHNFC